MPILVKVDWLLSNLSKRKRKAIEKYREFVAEGKNQPSPWQQLKTKFKAKHNKHKETWQKKTPEALVRRTLLPEDAM